MLPQIPSLRKHHRFAILLPAPKKAWLDGGNTQKLKKEV
jgi:hypothetical protein